ncbi:MAG: SURF1 family protein [Betaproteobacteria bacterium]|nr:MAG: SURF1 family protein [Betaproteobacteria bacterium]
MAALACVAFVSLGQWQSRRAEAKRATALELERAEGAAPIELAPGVLDAAALVHKRVAARGVFVADRTVLLNRLRRARPGYEVITPLRFSQSQWHVLVNRGWLPATERAPPEVRTPGGEQRIVGIALARLPRALEAGAASAGRVRQNIDIAAFGAETGLELAPFVIEQHSAADDGLARDWPRVDLGIERNESYALQWYSFAALALVLGVIMSFRRGAAR